MNSLDWNAFLLSWMIVGGIYWAIEANRGFKMDRHFYIATFFGGPGIWAWCLVGIIIDFGGRVKGNHNILKNIILNKD